MLRSEVLFMPSCSSIWSALWPWRSTWDLILACLRLLRSLRRHNTHNTCHITWCLPHTLTPLTTSDINLPETHNTHELLTFFWYCVPNFIIGHLSYNRDHHQPGQINRESQADIVRRGVTIMGVVTICLTCWLMFVTETTQEEPGQVRRHF